MIPGTKSTNPGTLGTRVDEHAGISFRSGVPLRSPPQLYETIQSCVPPALTSIIVTLAQTAARYLNNM